MAKITYDNKSYLNQNGSIPNVNKVNDTDMNEIKTVVNTNYDAMITLTPSGNFTSSSKFSELTVISCRLEQKLKAPCPIDVTDFGITMLVRPVQRIKAKSPIFVMPSGITMLVRLVQPWNAKL